MRFHPTILPGVQLVEATRAADERGWFARTWCEDEFAAHGIPVKAVQGSISWNRRRGTLRGLHFQLPPSREGKLVRCGRGAIFDVAVDLRSSSPTYLRHFGITLSAAEPVALYIPPGLAHGFMTLEDDTEVHYLMTDRYQAGLGAGVRWNDPAFGIRWPLPGPTVINDRDGSYPDFDPDGFDAFRDY
jgi:dTDP-4-dehydrorhamnose 3,5-epimerase